MAEHEDFEKEIQFLRRVAMRLADIHAANGQSTAMRRSSSKSEKNRQASICEDAAVMLGGTWPAGVRIPGDYDDGRIVSRLRDAISELRSST